jgi:hypothetical protein
MKTIAIALSWLIACLLPLGGQAGAQTITPNPFDFGNVGVGDLSPAQVFTFNNTSPDPATITAALLGGANPAQYQITANTCTVGLVVAAAGSCTVSVRFQPSASGTQVALVRVQFTQPPPNPPGGTEVTATLFGEGVAPPPAPALPAPGPGPLALAIATTALLVTGLSILRRRRATWTRRR